MAVFVILGGAMRMLQCCVATEGLIPAPHNMVYANHYC